MSWSLAHCDLDEDASAGSTTVGEDLSARADENASNGDVFWPRTLQREQSMIADRRSSMFLPRAAAAPKIMHRPLPSLNRGWSTPDPRLGRLAFIAEYASLENIEDAKKTLRDMRRRAVLVPECGSTPSQAALNMINVLMGSGLLALPLAVRECGGLAPGLALLVATSACTMFTAKLLGKELERRNARGFPDLAFHAFGRVGRAVVGVVLYFDIFMAMVLFLIMAGANANAVASSAFKLHVSNTACVRALALLLLPACVSLDDLSALSSSSALGTAATLGTILIVLYAYVRFGFLAGESKASVFGPPEVEPSEASKARAIGLVLYCFAGHALFPSLYRSLPAKGRQEAWLHVVNYSYGVVLGCSALVAALGYVLFGDAVSDQISVDVATLDPIAGALCCALVAFSALTKFLLELQPLALGLEELCGDPPAVAAVEDEEDELEDGDDEAASVGSTTRPTFSAKAKSAALRAALVLAALCAAELLPAFATVDALLGAVFATAISIVFPCAVALGAPHLDASIRAASWSTIVVGVCIGALGTWGGLTAAS